MEHRVEAILYDAFTYPTIDLFSGGIAVDHFTKCIWDRLIWKLKNHTKKAANASIHVYPPFC
jgi:hypothetical protein